MRHVAWVLCAGAALFGCGDDATGDDGDGGSGGAGAGSPTATNGTGMSTTGAGNVEPPGLEGITAAHNAARANVNPPAATPIPPLEWSPQIAAIAQAYAEECVFMHSDNDFGENLYATSGQASPEDVVDAWVSEVADYDYATNSCTNVCGHYTQVVWAESLRLGCGVAECATGSPFGGGAWQNWVCNYDPPGNFVGEKPY